MTKFRYPESKIETVTEKIHGVELKDDYRWLEGDEEGKTTPEVAEWTDKQNDFTRSILDNVQGRKELEARFKPLMETESVGLPEIAGKRIFYSKRSGGQNQHCFYYREEYFGEEKLLIDPNAMDKDGLLSVPWIQPTDDGKLLAYGSYMAGDENTTLHLIEVDTKKKIDEPIEGKVGGVCWLPDNSGFLYSKLEDVSNPYSRQICFHQMGDPISKDLIIFEQYKEGPLATTWGPFAHLEGNGKYMVLGYFTGTRSNDLWIADFEEYLKTGKLDLKVIAKDKDGNTHATVWQDKILIYTNVDAPNSAFFLADFDKPESWKDFIPERKDEVAASWQITKEELVVTYQQNASTSMTRFDKTGKELGKINQPGIGSVGTSGHKDSSQLFFGFTSFNSPAKIFLHNLETGEQKLWNEVKVPIDTSKIEVMQKWFTSKDGTRVSMFIMHHKDMKPNGEIPTAIYGYGGFGIPMTPGFSSINCTWVEDGGIYVVVNLRGGGEYGDDWHAAGMRENKERVFEDLEAAAQYMIDEGYTNPEKMAVIGRSNGGLLTGAALTRRPDLWKAVIVGVPLLDMIRYQNFLMARFWVPEYGSAEVKEEFEWIIKYSPYQNIKDGTEYPAIYIHTGENDTRVHPLHARKMAAALQKASKSHIDDKPVLLWVDRQSGHGMGKPLNLALQETVDQMLFLRWQLGL